MIWVAVVLCLLVSFVFSGIEAGIRSVNRVRLKHRMKMGDSAARTLDRLLARRGRVLVTALLVTNLMNILAYACHSWPDPASRPRSYVFSAIALPIYLFGVELLPKALFRRFPYRALAALAGPLRLADLILTPLHFIGDLLSRLFFGRRPAEQAKLFVAREDFKYLTIKSEREGTLSADERQMIHNVVDFRAITAREVMLPIENVQTVRPSTNLEELLTRATASRIDRWPVRTETGELTGLVNVFDIALTNVGLVESKVFGGASSK
jgi:CBS domain containing-hemolysin-like protein